MHNRKSNIYRQLSKSTCFTSFNVWIFTKCGTNRWQSTISSVSSVNLEIFKNIYIDFKKSCTKHSNFYMSYIQCFFFVSRVYRHLAYRRFVRWIWHFLGKTNRKISPACVVSKIREAFPSEQYCGFRYARWKTNRKGTFHTISPIINKYSDISSCLYNVVFYSVHNLSPCISWWMPAN